MNKTLHGISVLALMAFMCAAPVQAQDSAPPVPRSKTESLKGYGNILEQQQQEQKELEGRMSAQMGELKNAQERLVTLATSIQANEQELQKIDNRVRDLEEEKEVLEKGLEKERASIAKLLLALERIRRVPPQAMIARPETPYKAAQSAMLLGDIIPTLNEKAEKLKADLVRQDEIRAELKSQREKAEARGKDLAKEQITLAGLTQKREDIYKQTEKDYKIKEIEVEKISRQSRNVKDLVKNLENEKKRMETRDSVRQAVLNNPPLQEEQVPAPAPSPKKKEPPLIKEASLPPSGSARLPVSGMIKVHFNDPDKFGAKSEGIRIEGRGGGLVVAPMAGIIRFAGPFKNYHNMVIIEHDGEYHSLVAGMEKIDVMVGQKISAGEPVGTLKNTVNNEQPTLYYELRYKGNAVNPAKKITGLG